MRKNKGKNHDLWSTVSDQHIKTSLLQRKGTKGRTLIAVGRRVQKERENDDQWNLWKYDTAQYTCTYFIIYNSLKDVLS